MGGLFMINRKVMGAAGAAAVLGAGAFMVPAAASAHQARTHTLTFVSVTKSNHTFSRTTGASQNTDMKAGKVVGYDELYYRVVSKTAAVFWNTVDTSGGFLYLGGHVNINTDQLIGPGRVTGGSGKLRGARGTFTAKPLNKSGSRTAVVITYRSSRA